MLQNGNYIVNSTYPSGTEVEMFSFDALEVSWKNAKSSEEREHVTPHIYMNPQKFRIDSRLMSFAKKDAIFLHCLPRGSEVSEKVFFGKQSKVWQQALNRVYLQKSILLYCLGKLR